MGRPKEGTPVAPCARCSTLGGFVAAGTSRPARTTGRALGVDGVLCRACYQRLSDRARAEGGWRPRWRDGDDDDPEPSPREVEAIERRKALISNAKWRKWRRGRRTSLDPRTLDALLGPESESIRLEDAS
jgi:hypothetical protein